MNTTTLDKTVGPSVYVITAHGRELLRCNAGERVVELLSRHDVPWSSVSIYAKRRDKDDLELFPCLDTYVEDIDKDIEGLYLYFNRNVNPFRFSLRNFDLIADKDSEQQQAAEYFYQDLNNDHSDCHNYLKKLTPDECKSAIADRVQEVILENLPIGADLVVGISGGGDSNALLHGLAPLQEKHQLKIHPIIIKGIAEWDAGVPRAQELCDRYGLTLTVMESKEVQSLLKVPGGSKDLINRFEDSFAGDDFEFVGTLLVRLALGHKAREVGTQYICTGVNLEDALCENLFRLTNGLKVASYPLRNIGDLKLVFPLWLCPKRIIDGCFPKYTLQNYDARYPCFSLGRNLYYSLIFSIQSNFPGYPEQLALGLSELSKLDPIEYKLDEQLGFHVERFIPFPLRQKFLSMVGNA